MALDGQQIESLTTLANEPEQAASATQDAMLDASAPNGAESGAWEPDQVPMDQPSSPVVGEEAAFAPEPVPGELDVSSSPSSSSPPLSDAPYADASIETYQPAESPLEAVLQTDADESSAQPRDQSGYQPADDSSVPSATEPQREPENGQSSDVASNEPVPPTDQPTVTEAEPYSNDWNASPDSVPPADAAVEEEGQVADIDGEPEPPDAWDAATIAIQPVVADEGAVAVESQLAAASAALETQPGTGQDNGQAPEQDLTQLRQAEQVPDSPGTRSLPYSSEPPEQRAPDELLDAQQRDLVSLMSEVEQLKSALDVVQASPPPPVCAAVPVHAFYLPPASL